MIINKRSLSSIATVCVTTCIFMFGLWLLLAKAVDKIAQNKAEKTAIYWVNHFHSHLEKIDNLVTYGEATQKQAKVIDQAVSFGEVFLFKIFRPDGTISIKSNVYNAMQDDDYPKGVSEKALSVFRTGMSDISIQNGRQKINRPDVYVEAYVPITAAGKRLGTIEVYIDQTEMVASLKDGFYWIALFLPVINVLLIIACNRLIQRKNYRQNSDNRAISKF